MKVKEVIKMIEEKGTIKFHLEGLKKEGAEIAAPSTRVEYIDIAI